MRAKTNEIEAKHRSGALPKQHISFGFAQHTHTSPGPRGIGRFPQRCQQENL